MKAWVLDLDGVIYHGTEALPGAVDAVERLQRAGRRTLFLTNNSSKSSASICEKLVSLGIRCSEEDVLTSCEATGLYLERSAFRAVHAIGSKELKKNLTSRGMSLVGPDSCEALVVGMDLEFGYQALCDGLSALMRGAHFIACNRDPNFPGQSGRLLPGTGAIASAFEGASERKVDVLTGKPNPLILDLLLERVGLNRSDCVVVGDTLVSDIAMANQAMVPSIWIAPPEARLGKDSPFQPTSRFATLAEAVSGHDL